MATPKLFQRKIQTASVANKHDNTMLWSFHLAHRFQIKMHIYIYKMNNRMRKMVDIANLLVPNSYFLGKLKKIA
jgi:hypothetical protein